MKYQHVQATDPEIYALMADELHRQQSHLELIASENFVSEAVMEAMGSHLTNKYAEGLPGARYYGGCCHVDDVERIAITVTIYEAQERGQNFGQVSNAYVRLARRSSENDSVGTEELRYDLGEDFSVETALVVCVLYRSGATWKFNAVGAGYQGGLYALCKAYGVNV